MDKIKLKAYMRPNGRIIVCDQDNRFFEAIIPGAFRNHNPSEEVVEMGVELSMPHWPYEAPRVEVKFSIPLEVMSRSMELRLAEILGKL